MQADPELEAIRKRRMQELIAQRGGADERRQIMHSQILSSQAHERLARITLVKSEKARGVEDVILRAAQVGQILEKVAIFV
ncbi:putative PDCD5-like superfamily protein [Helianthus anomalus]